MKWYNYETSYQNVAVALVGYLTRKGIKYELSDASVGSTSVWHFEIYTDVTGCDAVNNWLDHNS